MRGEGESMLIIFMGFGQIVKGWEKKGGRRPTNLIEFVQLAKDQRKITKAKWNM